MTKLPEQFRRTPATEKFVRIMMGIVLFGAAVAIGNWAFPYITKFFLEGTKAIGSAMMFAATAFLSLMLVGIVVRNWGRLKMWYVGLCNKIGRGLVKSDPLEFMKTGIEIFEAKFQRLVKNKKIVRGKETYIAGEIKKNQDLMHEQLKLASAAQKMQKESLASHHAGLANTYKKSVEMLTPVFERISTNREFLDKLEENWAMGIDKLKTEVSVMETTFETLKATSNAADLAEEFMGGASEEGRVFVEAKKALEENMASMLANIDDFEQKTRPVIESMEMQKQVNADEGLKLLEELVNAKDGGLLMPTNINEWKSPAKIATKQNEFGGLI